VAGVSPAAPYRHFRDRDELLSSIAQRGFEQFEAALTRPGMTDVRIPSRRSSGSARPIWRLPAGEPAFYSAMFESGLPVDLNPALLAASERAFAVIRAAAERLAALAPPGTPRPPAMMMALHSGRCRMAWRRCSRAAMRRAASCRCRREDLLEAEVLIYLRGLGFLTERRASGQKDQAEPSRQATIRCFFGSSFRSSFRSLGQPK